MTKYILNSGSAKNFPQKEVDSIRETLNGLGTDVKILYCFFSQARENWESKFVKYKERFTKLAGDKVHLSFELAFPDRFEMQIQNADVVLIQGGDDHLLNFWFSKFDLEKIFKGKVIAASSAGSNILVESFWTCDWRECMDGLGILPIKFIPHYQSETYGNDDPRGPIDWDAGYAQLSEYGNKELPIHALKEGEYVVFEK